MILYIFFSNIFFTRMFLLFVYFNISRMYFVLHWNVVHINEVVHHYSFFNVYQLINIYYCVSIWFLIFNVSSLILYFDISFLNVFVLLFFLFSFFSVFLITHLNNITFTVFSYLLVGDNQMDTLFIRAGLCLLECFSLLSRCIALFLRLFCNLLSSHFLLTLFFDFMYFIIVLGTFTNQTLTFTTSSVCCFLIFNFVNLLFYIFLLMLDLFSAFLQVYILINMVHLSLIDWMILK